MSVVELHPDELLAKESRARLSASEKLRLDSHASKCAACRLERTMRQDFRVELESPQNEGAADVAMLVAAALGHTLQAPPSEPMIAQKSVRSPRRHARLGVIALIAAAILVIVASAAASWTEAWRATPKPPDAPVCVVASAAVEAKPKIASRHGRAIAAVDSPDPADSANVEDAVADPEIALPVPAAPPAIVDAPLTINPAPRPSATPLVVSKPVTVADPPPAHEPAAVTPTPAELFADASSARSRGDQAHAIALYREVLQRYPTSAEASVSRAALGRLLLDLGDLSASLAEFQGYLQRGDGVLAEEAMVGRAEALARMGSPAEKGAWTMLLATYPRSVHAARARARLAALEGQ